MNPYDFVRLDPAVRVPRRAAPLHHVFSGISGRLEGTITTLTPLFIPGGGGGQGGDESAARTFRCNRRKQPIIPGSSLKGLMRSLVETIGPGCWWLLGAEHQTKLPADYHQCQSLDDLCPACRMFGLIHRNQAGGGGERDANLEGHVRFDDGVCASPMPAEAMYTPILSNPKPRHTAWYFGGPNGIVTGRKYYFHQNEILREPTLRTTRLNEVAQNIEIQPIGVGSVFTFSAQFENVEEDDLQLLLYALTLEPEMRHKIGYAKPAGLGSIEIKLTRVETRNMAQRYTRTGKLGGAESWEGEAVTGYLATQTHAFRGNTTAVALADLRRIWHWPPSNVHYQYPTQGWFKANPTTPISGTP